MARAAGAIPLCVGGDHSISLPILRAVARRHGPVGVIHFDAHPDTWDEYFGSKFFHGTPFRRAVEEGLLDAAASVQAGMRGSIYGDEDYELSRELGFDLVTSDELRP